jgi:hypothetical protein
MRWLVIPFVLCAACATTAPAPALTATIYGERPSQFMPLAIEAAQAQRFEVALVNDHPVFDRKRTPSAWGARYSFLALTSQPSAADPRLAVAYVVQVIGTRADYPQRITVAVTPFGYHGDEPVAARELPPDVWDRARTLITAITDHARSNRDLSGF